MDYRTAGVTIGLTSEIRLSWVELVNICILWNSDFIPPKSTRKMFQTHITTEQGL